MAKHNNNILRMPSKFSRKANSDLVFTVGFYIDRGFSPLSWLIRKLRNIPYSEVCIKFRDKKFRQAKVFYTNGININYSAEKNFDKNYKITNEFQMQADSAFYDEFLNECFRHANVKYGFFKRKNAFKLYEWLAFAIQEKDESWKKIDHTKVTHKNLFFYFKNKQGKIT